MAVSSRATRRCSRARAAAESARRASPLVRQPRPAHCRSSVRDDGLVVLVRGQGVLSALPVAAGGAEGAHGGGVAAAFGGEVAAVAEHVRPAAQGLVILVRVGADLEAGADEPSLVGALVGVDFRVVRGDPAGRDPGGLGAFGRVFGQVGRDRDIGDLAVVGEPDDARVDLGAPGDVPAVGLGWMSDGGEPSGGGDLADETGEHISGDGWWRLDGALGMGRVVAVEPEDGVEVDQAAALELGDLGIGQPDACAMWPGELVEAAAQGDDGAPPQLGGVGVPDDGGVVVVAVGAQRPCPGRRRLRCAAGRRRSVVRAGSSWPCGGDGTGRPSRRA